MRKILATVGFVLVFAGHASMARTLLACKGYSVRLNAEIDHAVSVDGSVAELDGKPYQSSETATQYTLTGPAPANDTIVYINRLTGEYAITPSSIGGDPKVLEWSREGEGCRKQTQRF